MMKTNQMTIEEEAFREKESEEYYHRHDNDGTHEAFFKFFVFAICLLLLVAAIKSLQ